MELTKNYKKAFLESVSSYNNQKVYRVVLCNDSYTEVDTAIVDSEVLSEICEKVPHTDFKIQKDYLLTANQNIPTRTLPTNTVINSISVDEDETYSLYSFLREAIENEYRLIPNDLENCSKYFGTGAPSFRNLRCSESTLSLYVPVVSEGGLHNHMIVNVLDSILKFNEFYFAVPLGKTPGKFFDFHKSMEINGQMYFIYKSGELSVYPAKSKLVASLINDAVWQRESNACIKKTLADLKSVITEKNEDSGLKWVGHNNSYSPDYGVKLTCSIRVPNEALRSSLIKMSLSQIRPMYSAIEDAFAHVNNLQIDALAKLVCKTVLTVVYSSNNLADSLDLINYLSQGASEKHCEASLFLYKIRVYCFLLGIKLSEIFSTTLQGSTSPGNTIVKEGKVYGE